MLRVASGTSPETLSHKCLSFHPYLKTHAYYYFEVHQRVHANPHLQGKNFKKNFQTPLSQQSLNKNNIYLLF